MDLNHIELPAGIVAELYRSSLVIADPPQQNEEKIQPVNTKKVTETAVETKGQKWVSLGNNQKNILITVTHNDLTHLPDEDLGFLTGILGACQLSLDDVAIINLAHYENVSYKELVKHFKSKIVFLFGTEPASFGLPMNFPHFQVQSFASISFLFSPPLQEFKDDKVLKSKLWVSLRRIFGI